ERTGQVPREEMEKTFNMGVGMVAVVAEDDAERALAMLTARHVGAWKLGEVRVAESGSDNHGAYLTGEYRRS
ncbi:MAG TPA: phosphoribosylformylglycinamidine cyclo-ligase, partial [Candidatus Corynebacterium gallistercoris]|nr:phosphoribosylformylglycinamidine cyclo-ligase [Candidatus Corynebacterium gallistercoris]